MLIKVSDERQRCDGVARNMDPLPCVIPVGMPEAAELVKSGKVDVFVANKANLVAISDKLRSRVLDSRFSVDRFALAVPKTREAETAYVRNFIENVRPRGSSDLPLKRLGSERVLFLRLELEQDNGTGRIEVAQHRCR